MSLVPAALIPASLSLGIVSFWQGALFSLLIAGSLFLAWFSYRSTEPPVAGPRRFTLTSLRALVLLILLVMLLEPVLHLDQDRDVDPSVLLLVDSSGSMGIEGNDGGTRSSQALFLRDRARSLLTERDGDLHIYEGEGSRRLLASREAGEVGSAARPAMGEGTNLPALLISAAQRHLEDNLQAILLLSDGVSTANELPSLGGLRVPVFTMAVGDTTGPADLRLDRVRYPTLAYRGEDIQIEAEVVVDASRAGVTHAVLEAEAAPAESLLVQWPAGGGRVPIRFDVACDSLGPQDLRLRVLPLPSEALDANNAVAVGYEVRKDRLRVSYVESRPSWNFHFLSRRAASDARFDVRGLYRGEDGWRVAGSDSTWSPPKTLAQARDVDAWIFGSLDDLSEMADTAPGITQSVRAGAGLLVLFGEATRRSLRPLSPAARELLPVDVQNAARWVESNHRVRPTAFGLGHPILAFGSTLGSVADRLSEMPPLWEAVHALQPKPESDEILRIQAAENSAPLLVVSKIGLGTAASWSAAPLWSWSFWRLGASEGQQVFDVLMGNLLYYLAEGGDRSRLRLTLPRAVLAQGEDARLRGLALDRRLQPDESSDVWLEWLASSDAAPDSLGEPTGRVRMDVDRETPGGREIALPALPAGQYYFRLALEEGVQRLTSSWHRLVIDPYSVEYRQPRIDLAALKGIAETTGGSVLSAADLAPWSARLPLEERHTVLTSRIDLWSSLWLFLPFLGLLVTEWILRKRWGLV